MTAARGSKASTGKHRKCHKDLPLSRVVFQSPGPHHARVITRAGREMIEPRMPTVRPRTEQDATFQLCWQFDFSTSSFFSAATERP